MLVSEEGVLVLDGSDLKGVPPASGPVRPAGKAHREPPRLRPTSPQRPASEGKEKPPAEAGEPQTENNDQDKAPVLDTEA